MSKEAYKELTNGNWEKVFAVDEYKEYDPKQKYRCCGHDPAGAECCADMSLNKGRSCTKKNGRGDAYFIESPTKGSKGHIHKCSHSEKKATKDILVVDNDISKLLPANILEKWSRQSKDMVIFPKGGPDSPPEDKPDKGELEEDEREAEERLKKPNNVQALYGVFEKNELDAVTQDGRRCKDWIINERTYSSFRKCEKSEATAIARVKKCSNKDLYHHLMKVREKNTYFYTVMDTSSSTEDTRIYFLLSFDREKLKWETITEITGKITKRGSDWLAFANWKRFEVGGQYKDCMVYIGVISSVKQIVEFKR